MDIKRRFWALRRADGELNFSDWRSRILKIIIRNLKCFYHRDPIHFLYSSLGRTFINLNCSSLLSRSKWESKIVCLYFDALVEWKVIIPEFMMKNCFWCFKNAIVCWNFQKNQCLQPFFINSLISSGGFYEMPGLSNILLSLHMLREKNKNFFKKQPDIDCSPFFVVLHWESAELLSSRSSNYFSEE